MIFNKNKRCPQSLSIWLLPNNEVKKHLYQEIVKFSNKYNTPIFNPHVTLISNLICDEKVLLDKIENLIHFIPPFKIYFSNISFFDEYFQCLFIKIKKTKELIRARQLFYDKLAILDKSYMPHLSLIYGDFSIKEKEHMVCLFNKKYNNFEVKDIALVFSDEINLKWEVIRSFSLR